VNADGNSHLVVRFFEHSHTFRHLEKAARCHRLDEPGENDGQANSGSSNPKMCPRGAAPLRITKFARSFWGQGRFDLGLAGEDGTKAGEKFRRVDKKRRTGQ